ncbi:MAG: hypothetical protein EKK48_26255 [Candidatus Melainabacteria bacterium]|nr:MAG: hypothetical protein EKK48_26255 [Candidatus Melainabacteria bacterium]
MTDDDQLKLEQERKQHHEPVDEPWELTSPQNLFRIIVGVIVYSILQGCINSFNGLVNWSAHPGMSTVNDVIMSMQPAMALGGIRGVILALMTVTIVMVGPRIWAVIGPVLGVAARNSLRFVQQLSIAVRATGKSDRDGDSDGATDKGRRNY